MADTILLERVLLEAAIETLIPAVRHQLTRSGQSWIIESDSQPVGVPPDAQRGWVSQDIYDAYRLGLTSSCADVVCVQNWKGKLRVLLQLRSKAPFSGVWWMQGGVVPNFRPIPHMLLWRIHAELGLSTEKLAAFVTKNRLADTDVSCRGVTIAGLIGVYRTTDSLAVDGRVCDTINLCYLAILPGEFDVMFDAAHSATKWVTKKDLGSMPLHWYTERTVRRAFAIVEQAIGT